MATYITSIEKQLLQNISDIGIGEAIKKAIGRWKNHCLSIVNGSSPQSYQDKHNAIELSAHPITNLVILAEAIDNMKVMQKTREAKADSTHLELKERVKEVLDTCDYTSGSVTPEAALKTIHEHADALATAKTTSHDFAKELKNVLMRHDPSEYHRKATP